MFIAMLQLHKLLVAKQKITNTPDDGRLRPKHVECPCRNKTCTVLHQAGVSFDLHVRVTFAVCSFNRLALGNSFQY